jgi:hypothetical protein
MLTIDDDNKNETKNLGVCSLLSLSKSGFLNGNCKTDAARTK